MKMEVPDDVMNAIVTFVAMQRSFDPDNDGWIENHYPILCSWLERLGLLPSGDDENLEETDS
jgi:hypothetical protein